MLTKKRYLAVLAAATAVTFVLAGCAGGTASPTTEDGFSTALPAADTEATISIWGYIDDSTSQWLADGQALMAEEFPNVTVNYTYLPYDQILPKLLATSVSGGAPDGILYNPADAANLYQSGIAGDLTPFWSEFADASQFPEAVIWKDGDAVISVQGYLNTTALYYNKTLLDAASIEPPTTIAELDAALEAITASGSQGLTMTAVPTAESEFQILPWLLGDGQNYGSWDQAAVETVFTQFRDRITNGYIPQDVVGWSQGDAWDKFSGGDFAFTQNGNWQLGKAADLPFEWGVVPLPAGTAGSFSVGGGEGFSISADSENAALTWHYFQKLLLEKDGQIKILEATGSIPVRNDTASAPEISSDPALSAFAEVVANLKARPSTPNISEYLVTMGKIWNAVAGGTTTPADGAAQVVEQLSDLQ